MTNSHRTHEKMSSASFFAMCYWIRVETVRIIVKKFSFQSSLNFTAPRGHSDIFSTNFSFRYSVISLTSFGIRLRQKAFWAWCSKMCVSFKLLASQSTLCLTAKTNICYFFANSNSDNYKTTTNFHFIFVFQTKSGTLKMWHASNGGAL